MSASRPRLLVVDGPLVPAAELARALANHFEVVVAPPGGGDDALRSAEYQAILAGTVEYLSLDRPLSERESNAVLEAIGEGVCLASSEGRILWANERFRAYDAQVVSRIEAVCRRAVQRFEEMAKTGNAGRPLPPGKFEVASPDNAQFYEAVVSVVGGAAGAAPGKVVRVAAVVRDVTSARRTQQKMDAIDRAGSELVRLDAESVRKLHVGERLKLLEEKIVKFSHELMHFDHLAIRLLDERTGKLELVMASGLPPEAMELELYASREGNGIMGYVAATGRSYLCPDVTKDKRYLTGLYGARSSLTVPLRLHDKVIGAFNVESERVNAFTEEDRQFAEMFANHVALAVHILDLLVVERCATGETVTGTVEGELSQPLEDIIKEADTLRKAAGRDPGVREHLDRISTAVRAIRQRVREAAEGPQNILGAEKALLDLVIEPALVGKRVLVADDEPRIRQTIRDVLRGRGCSVTVCADGGAAIAEFELAIASKADVPPHNGAGGVGGGGGVGSEAGAGGGGAGGDSKPYDLVISDIKIPDRNGYEVFAAIRRLDPEMPVILMTGFGYDPHHSIVRASQEGLQCVLFKPFQVERLLEEVRKALKVKAPTS